MKIDAIYNFNMFHCSYGNDYILQNWKAEIKKSLKNVKEIVLATITKLIESFVVIATTTTSVKLSISGFSWMVIPVSNGIPFRLLLAGIVKFEKIVTKYTKNRNYKEPAEKTIIFFDKPYNFVLHDNTHNW